ncbi:outer membrane protein assembly factor BamB family protein [Pontibacter cellulosilyticus]|uniref:PQQ-binding-like beta-propeller repeat protein n=1 Tax=Pontibacter cellulosilyticus TaxID=1720253 RepID=A0A923N4L1_9BACT|nr:PQQ-binding-like beta-propeller repeat protein [Pontibacter cellulosilyticus]MBC5992121.1 PQQ-binding-like beta-propeller repeat protein [Pontibacter cellulosilyticus]
MKTILHTQSSLKWLILTLLYLTVAFITSAQSVQEKWAQRFDASISDVLQNYFLAVDQSGNLYTAGIRQNEENRKYIQVSKFSIDGTLRWVNSYHTSAGSFLPDIQIDEIAVDDAGELYVIGTNQGSDSRYQSLTLKFSSANGSLLWEQAFRIGMFSYAREIEIDNQGDVYVLSTTDGGPLRTLSNITITKYNSADGAVLWGGIYDGGVNGSDDPEAIALDNHGGVYVLGSSDGSGTRSDILIIKYNAESGQQEWLQRLDIGGQTQEALNVTADHGGSIYVTGSHANSSETVDTKALIVKYNAADGTQLWLSLEDGSSNQNMTLPSLPTSNSEGLFVIQSEIGVSNSNHLVKYDSGDGTLAWARLFAGTPIKTLQDTGGNIIVVGKSNDTGNVLIVKYSKSDGSLIWQQEYVGNAVAGMAVTLNENQGILTVAAITPAGGAKAGAVILTYSTESGENFIVAPIALGQSNETSVAIAVDDKGNSYVAGNISSNVLGNSIILLKYSPDGVLLWQSTDVANSAVAYDMVIDKQGGIFITGTNRGNAIYTAKFSQNDGAKIWDENFSYIGDEGNIGYAIVSNDAGEIYVTGSVKGRLTDGMAIIKYNAETGETIWNNVLIQPIDINNTTFLNYIGRTIALDASGDIYIAGELRERQSDYLIAKVNSEDGKIVWSKIYGSPSSIFERATAIEIAVAGEVYVTGISNGDFATIKLNPSDGAILWESRLETNSPGSGTGANALALDNKGGVYVTGQKAGSIEALIVKYNAADGSELWRKALENTIGYTIKTDSKGGVYVAGAGPAVAKYNTSNGDLLWEQRPDTVTGSFVDLVVDKQLDVYVTGAVQSKSINSTDILTIKYSQQGDVCNIPVQVRLYLPPVAKRVGWQVRTTADFRPYILGADHGVRWSWGDGSASSIAYTASGTSRITGEHTYLSAGFYQIGLDFSQSCLKPANAGYEQWMPIYDPEAGFVTGAGQTEGIRFNLNARYNGKWATEPQGNVQLDIEGLGRLRSADLEWLVVSGDKAAFQGESTIDGRGRYGFTLSVTDAGSPGANDAGDRLRVQVWDLERHSRVVYDNGSSQILDLSNQGPTIQQGNIVIHRPGKASMAAKAGSKAQAAEGGSQLTAYPNTFSERTTVSFSLNQGQSYTLNVYDTAGRLVRQVAAGTAETGGPVEHELNGAGLNEGLYIAKLLTSGSSQSIKLLLKR